MHRIEHQKVEPMQTQTSAASPQRPRLRRTDVPRYLAAKHGIDIAVSTLAKMATVGGGPMMQYSGRIPLYHINDLDTWAQGRLTNSVQSTSEVRHLSKRAPT